MTFAREREDHISELAAKVGRLASADGLTVAVAESLTAGRIAHALGCTVRTTRHEFEGQPAEAVEVTTLFALRGLRTTLLGD